jgi:hypothetical protein
MLTVRRACHFLLFATCLQCMPLLAYAGERADGFALGQLAQSTHDLAADLYFIVSLSGQFAAGKEELVGADPNNTDFALAGGALTYSIWQTKLAVVPACEDLLGGDALNSPVLKDYRQELRDMLEAVQANGEAFLAGAASGDAKALGVWTANIASEGYVERLLDLSRRMAQQGNAG